MTNRLATLIAILLTCVVTLVWADKPPQALYQHVTTTSQLVHQGVCDVASLGVKDTTCLIFYNVAIERVWVVLFDTDKNGAPQVTRVLLVDEVGREVVAWCRQDVCV